MSEMKVAMVKLLHNYKMCWDDSTNLQHQKGDMFLFTFPSIKLRFIRRNASQQMEVNKCFFVQITK